MLEYTIEEAEELLTKNLQAALKNLNQIDSDLSFLRDQITTTEVSILFMKTSQFEMNLFESMFYSFFLNLLTFLLLTDMARVFNWDVKRRQSEKS